jgi:hypothetical protein
MDVACEGFSDDEKKLFASFLHRFRHGLEERYLRDSSLEATSEVGG